MTVRVSVNYNDPRWKRCDLKKYVTLLFSKVLQTHQMRLTDFSLSVLACSDSKIKELNKNDGAKYTIEADDDGGQIQQVSGGFGDSNTMDEDTIKAMVK